MQHHCPEMGLQVPHGSHDRTRAVPQVLRTALRRLDLLGCRYDWVLIILAMLILRGSNKFWIIYSIIHIYTHLSILSMNNPHLSTLSMNHLPPHLATPATCCFPRRIR